MKRSARHLLPIALAVGFYLLAALPLPCLLLDHDAAMAAGDSAHSSVDIHAWLEWAAGSSLSTGHLVIEASQPFVGPALVPQLQIPVTSPVASLWSRGPPSC